MIKLTEDPQNHKFTFHFLNGSIDFYEEDYGAYAICPGCGSGKTTLIRELIRLRWYDGVLYTAFTKDELDNMYEWLLSNAVGKSVNPRNNEILKSDDIIVLHSGNSKGTDHNLWMNNPTKLLDKKVILCTHAKLLDEPLHLLVSTNFNNRNYYPPTYLAMNSIAGSLPRQWILIDESTESRTTLATATKSLFLSLGECTNKWRTFDELGRPITVEVDQFRVQRRCIYYDDFKDQFKMVCNLAKEFRHLLRDESSELNRVRNERLMENIYNDFHIYANSSSDNVKIYSCYTDMIVGNIKSHVLLFDGTSDITLKNSTKFHLMSLGNRKYNSPISLYRFPFNITRRLKLDKSADVLDSDLKSKLDDTVEILKDIVSTNGKTLIFTWKDIKSDSDLSEVNDSAEEEYSTDIVQSKITVTNSINKSFSLISYIKSKLESAGLMSGDKFSIEYYGSGKDKATNDYREYDTIVLLGKYMVPQSVIYDFNMMFGTNIISPDYYTNRVIQAICRTRIRLHDESPIKIYMSNDWSETVVSNVKEYLGIGDVYSFILSKNNATIDEMYYKLRNKGITPKKAEQIAKLSTLDSGVFNAIMSDTTYHCIVNLDEIYTVLPMSEKKSKSYNSLGSTLFKKYNIVLDIL